MKIILKSGSRPGGGGLNLDQMGMCHQHLNLPRCSGVEKPKKYTLFWNQEYRIVSCRVVSCRIVLYCIVLYCIVLYCIVLYCIVLYCIVLYCIVLYCIVGMCHQHLNLPRCSGVEKPKKYTLFWNQEYRIVSYRIVSYRIVSYRIVSYRIVSYRSDGYVPPAS